MYTLPRNQRQVDIDSLILEAFLASMVFLRIFLGFLTVIRSNDPFFLICELFRGNIK